MANTDRSRYITATLPSKYQGMTSLSWTSYRVSFVCIVLDQSLSLPLVYSVNHRVMLNCAMQRSWSISICILYLVGIKWLQHDRAARKHLSGRINEFSVFLRGLCSHRGLWQCYEHYDWYVLSDFKFCQRFLFLNFTFLFDFFDVSHLRYISMGFTPAPPPILLPNPYVHPTPVPHICLSESGHHWFR